MALRNLLLHFLCPNLKYNIIGNIIKILFIASFHGTVVQSQFDELDIDNCAPRNGINPKRLNELTSPGFPGKYPQNVDCIRTIHAPDGYDIVLRFRDIFQIESTYEFPYQNDERKFAYNCPHDFVELRDGRFPFSPFLARLCGMRLPKYEIRAQSGHFWIWFHSDALFEYRGFVAHFEFVGKEVAALLENGKPPKKKECYFQLSLPMDGYIKSEDIAEFYENKPLAESLECVWEIQVPKLLQVALFIEEFEMGVPNQCFENSLELYTGRYAAVPFRRFCGVTATHIYTGESLVYLRLSIPNEAYLLASRLRILFSTYLKLPNCTAMNLFDCGDDICIPQSLVCNGRTNCLYRRDEINCSWSIDPFGALYRSGHLPLIILLTILISAVSLLCFYYKPCKKRPRAFARGRNIFIKSRASSLVTENAAGQSQRPSRCSEDVGKGQRTLMNRLAALSKSIDDEWSLSDLSLHEHHANCQKQNNGPMANGQLAQRRGSERRATLVHQKNVEGGTTKEEVGEDWQRRVGEAVKIDREEENIPKTAVELTAVV